MSLAPRELRYTPYFQLLRSPFAEKVVGRPALCMMTSNVFGSIAAENLGYAKVVLEQAIARGDSGCRVVVYPSYPR